MRTLEEITYEAGRAALDDQERLVAGIRQRTGTLVAAHALLAAGWHVPDSDTKRFAPRTIHM